MREQDQSLDELAEQHFRRYCEAARKAQANYQFSDAREAGQAWAAFLDVFLPEPVRVRAGLRAAEGRQQ